MAVCSNCRTPLAGEPTGGAVLCARCGHWTVLPERPRPILTAASVARRVIWAACAGLTGLIGLVSVLGGLRADAQTSVMVVASPILGLTAMVTVWFVCLALDRTTRP